jgi:hypothetical protein
MLVLAHHPTTHTETGIPTDDRYLQPLSSSGELGDVDQTLR